MTDQEKADRIIDGVCQRLERLTSNRPLRFINTPREDAEKYQQLQTSFAGYAEAEIAQAEKRIGVAFPTVFRTYLKRMGKNRGELFVGSDIPTLDKLEQFREYSQGLMVKSNVAKPLPPSAIVFLLHQGYTFCYLLAEGGFDTPVWNYLEGQPEPEQRFASFHDLLLDEIALMEEVNQKSLERGGHYLQLNAEGGATRYYPALSSGERPASRDDIFPDDAPPSELAEWTDQLADAIAKSLAEYSKSAKEYIEIFAVDCHPWDGMLGLAFLTQSEANDDPLLSDPAEMAAWKHYDFAPDLALGKSGKKLMSQMRRAYENAGEERGRVAESYLRACAAAVAKEQVREALRAYRLSSDFRITVPHPDSNKEYFIPK